MHDLVLAKCAAGQPRDWNYAKDALRAGLVHREALLQRVADLPLADETRARVHAAIAAMPLAPIRPTSRG